MLFFSLAHCHVPQRLLDWVERQLRAFIWDHSVDHHRWHYIGWEFFCEDKLFGGAGILDVNRWYEALMCKLAFKVMSEPLGKLELAITLSLGFKWAALRKLPRSGKSCARWAGKFLVEQIAVIFIFGRIVGLRDIFWINHVWRSPPFATPLRGI